MKIKELILYSQNLDAQLRFYTNTLGFELVEQSKDSLSIKIGWSVLKFVKSEVIHRYHYCLLIPSNTLEQALEWMQQRTEVIEIEPGRSIQNFESWNADSFYFYDGNENLAECIVRYDLKNGIDADFDKHNFLGVNEIGMPTLSIEKINNQLERELGTKFWKGDLRRFGTHGDQEGLLLLPNYKNKDTWFPTTMKVRPAPFKSILEVENRKYSLLYKNSNLSIHTLPE